MKILIYGLNYSPELTGIGKYTGAMSDWLSLRGHNVKVVTAPPYYPEWKVHAGYSAWRYIREPHASNAADVYRCPLWVPRRATGITRILHLASFMVTSLPLLFWQVWWRPQIIFTVEPALFCAPSTWLVARLCGAKAWLHVQDFEVDAAFALGILRNRKLKKFVWAIEGWLLGRFDCVSTISPNMVKTLEDKRVAADRRVLFPNWVDTDTIRPLVGTSSYRDELGITLNKIVALYSGNMGAKQGLEILAQVAERMQDDSRLAFVFCGNGVGRADLMARCAGLRNVHFLDLQPAEKLGALLATADIHLLPQRADAADLVMPSKLTGMLASGRPVIATAHAGTALAQVVAGCGLVVPPENPEALANAITTLAANPIQRESLGRAARSYAENKLSGDAILGAFEKELIKLCAAGRSKRPVGAK